MKKLLIQDRKKRDLYEEHINKRNLLRRVAKILDIAGHKRGSQLPVRQEVSRHMQQLPRNSSLVRLNNCCVYTGRSMGTYRKYKMSRHLVHELAMAGQLPLRKASW